MSFVDTAASVVGSIIGDALAPYAAFFSTSRYIGSIVPDVTVREVHSDTNTITQHPVESGSPISDHVFANPQVIEISGGFSDSTGGYAGYSIDAYNQTLALKATRDVFDVSTGKRLYTSMLFQEISVVTDPTSEYALMFTVRMQQVIISQTSSTSSGSNVTSDNQANPSETAPTTDSGPQVTLPYEVTEGVSADVPLPPSRPDGIGTNSSFSQGSLGPGGQLGHA